MEYTTTSPAEIIPPLLCDFHSCGSSNEPDDNCYYTLDRLQLAALVAESASIVVIYDNDISDEGEPQIAGCLGKLELIELGGTPCWRVRPLPGSWYQGLKPDYWTQSL